MRNKPRDVTGGEAMWGRMIPGLGMMNYFLGLLTVPIEVFLRWDFGERYFTRKNFIGGILVLIGWVVLAKVFAFFNLLNPLAWALRLLSPGDEEETGNGMGTVIKWYFIFGIFHFLTIWWRDITNKPLHSFSPGRSWLGFIGEGVMFVLNLFLNAVVRLIFSFRQDSHRVQSLLPVLRDSATFTERFIEPVFVFIWAMFCMLMGLYAMGFWLIFSCMALNMYTGLRHEQERSQFLDFRDQMIDAQGYKNFRGGEGKKIKTPQERMIEETAREVEKNPDVLPIIEKQNPSLAEAIERISPKLKAIAEQDSEPGGGTLPV